MTKSESPQGHDSDGYMIYYGLVLETTIWMIMDYYNFIMVPMLLLLLYWILFIVIFIMLLSWILLLYTRLILLWISMDYYWILYPFSNFERR